MAASGVLRSLYTCNFFPKCFKTAMEPLVSTYLLRGSILRLPIRSIVCGCQRHSISYATIPRTVYRVSIPLGTSSLSASGSVGEHFTGTHRHRALLNTSQAQYSTQGRGLLYTKSILHTYISSSVFQAQLPTTTTSMLWTAH